MLYALDLLLSSETVESLQWTRNQKFSICHTVCDVARRNSSVHITNQLQRGFNKKPPSAGPDFEMHLVFIAGDNGILIWRGD